MGRRMPKKRRSIVRSKSSTNVNKPGVPLDTSPRTTTSISSSEKSSDEPRERRAPRESQFVLGQVLRTVLLLTGVAAFVIGFEFWVHPFVQDFFLARGQLVWPTSMENAGALCCLVLPVVFTFLLRFLEGFLLYGVILGLGLYHKSFHLLVESTFSDDAPPSLNHKAGNLVTNLVSYLVYYGNLVGLSTSRRLAYIMLDPSLFHLSNVLPSVLLRKVEFYIEASLLSEPKRHDEDERTYNHRVDEEFRRLVVDDRHRTDEHDSGPDFDCPTLFRLFGPNHARIWSYLKAKREMNLPPQFITTINLESGFLAPAYLVSGLLHAFDEDWTYIMKGSGDDHALLTSPTGADPLRQIVTLRKLQSFIWSCWTQWGPSIPICETDRWLGQRSLALQYGYGDENNSVLLIRRGYRFREWQAWLGKRPRLYEAAWPVRVSGHLRLYDREDWNREVVPAQQKGSREGEGILCVECDEINYTSDETLYSAYVWAMVAICRREGERLVPLIPQEDDLKRHYELEFPNDFRKRFPADTSWRQSWRALIPFFQHGNIADDEVLADIKEELAVKTVDTLLRYRSRAIDSGMSLVFAFVCCSDDNGDGRSPLCKDEPSVRTLIQEALRRRSPEVGIPPKIANSPWDAGLELHWRKAGIYVNPRPELAEFTADRLPNIVGDYLDHISRISKVIPPP